MTTRPRPDRPPTLATILTRVSSRAGALTPGTIVGAGVYVSTGQVRDTILACVLVPPAVAGGKVLAEWVRLLAPPKRWRRPRRRGT